MSTELNAGIPLNINEASSSDSFNQSSEKAALSSSDEGSELESKSQRVASKNLGEAKETKSFNLFKKLHFFNSEKKEKEKEKEKDKSTKIFEKAAFVEESSSLQKDSQEGLIGFFKNNLSKSKRKKKESQDSLHEKRKVTFSEKRKKSFVIPPLLLTEISKSERKLSVSSSLKRTNSETCSMSGSRMASESDLSADLLSAKREAIDWKQKSSFKLSFNERFLSPVFEKIENTAQEVRATQEKFKFQNGEASYFAFLAIEIANLLIMDDGEVNISLIPAIIDFFISNDPVLNHEASLYYSLKAIFENDEIVELIKTIEAPNRQTSPAADLIRITLNIPLGESVNDRQAKITALSALLSHHRQSFEGSCFATHFAIALLANDPLACLKDFKDLLKRGSLTRTIGGIKKPFPFLMRTGEESLSQTITITKSGEIKELGTYIWKAPSIQKALHIAGFHNSKIPSKKVLSKLIPSGEQTICMHELLKALAEQALKLEVNKGRCLQQIYFRMTFAFEAVISNPLLRAFDNSLAEMAEANEQGMITKPVVYAITNPIEKELKQFLKKEKESKKEAILLYNTFKSIVLKRIHLHYDPDINEKMENHEHFSKEGGFVLYDTKGKSLTSKWTRIDSPESFREFISDMIVLSFNEILPTLSELEPDLKKEKELIYNRLVKRLRKYINSKFFLLESLSCFYPANLKMNDPLKSWRKSQYTPWRTIAGNFGEKVREIYNEKPLPSEKKLLPVDNTEICLMTLAEVRNLYRASGDKDSLINCQSKVPVYTRTHAFNLIFGHPSFQHLNSDDPKSSYNSLIDLSLKLSEDEFEESKRELLSSQFLLAYNESHFKGNLNFEALKNFMKELTFPISCKNFWESSLKFLEGQSEASQLSPQENAFLIDRTLCSCLSETTLFSMQRNAIHFADTNWKNGLHDIHFCIAPHPGTGTLRLFEIQDDNQKITPIHDFFIFEKPWEFY
ncbi:hypothetical protein [Criblamydia sequanensis]|uniref:Uncharacterized protein n=1 Tax=Candidatus Criblamydia sequanensis CRIB-18 TaxID=1437425 RepID=A0A090D1Y0_9BACT|nr:hypothetical protein [Criblamydia sequanensis]CDR33873.1 hypothetical protein CSEC_1047 [Criblamydia sequanensis CRIB-18]